MSWNLSYGSLILISTIVTWGSGQLLQRQHKKKELSRTKAKAILWVCILINLGILFVFKYANWAIDILDTLSAYFTWGIQVPKMDVLLPVGISFYTFQAIGYTIDVYRGTINSEKNIFTYALFVSFFPQLVAGPIERAKNLLPQFHAKHYFDSEQTIKGIQLMVWGYFMKLCVADRAAIYVDAVYNNLPNHNGLSILLASLLFTIQIYCDFCGYSLIAIGVAKVIGFNLMENFHRPYFSTNIRKFWKRWHISLSTWFMDYVYIPLGGNRCSVYRHLLNLFITFVVSGMWHGANWTFLIWGAYHGVLIVINTLWSKYGLKIRYIPAMQRFINGFCTFVLVAFGWIFFRANSIEEAIYVIKIIFTNPGELYLEKTNLILVVFSILILLINEFIKEFNYQLSKNKIVVDLSYALFIIVILVLGCFDGGKFIYFQF